MTIFTLVFITIFLMMASRSSNPVKTSVAILILGVTMFVQMGLSTGAGWIPLLMAMLFMGGIIMMFMILSAVLPNEKSMKVKNFFILAAALSMTAMGSGWALWGGVGSEKYKSFMVSGNNFWAMMGLILVYFISSLSTLNSEETPMRTLYCC